MDVQVQRRPNAVSGTPCFLPCQRCRVKLGVKSEACFLQSYGNDILVSNSGLCISLEPLLHHDLTSSVCDSSTSLTHLIPVQTPSSLPVGSNRPPESDTMAATVALPGVNMFEVVSDDIDHVNIHKGQNDVYEKSKSDQEKDTITFR
jgi:hypothetical protein